MEVIYPNTKRRVENTTLNGVLLRKFEVFRWPMKHCRKCLIYILNQVKCLKSILIKTE